MNAIVPIQQPDPLVPRDLDQAIKLAQVMASAKMVPQHLQGDVGTCLMIVEQALRWHMSPFAVAQCTSNIRGKLMFEGKLVAAACESMGAIEGGFDYGFDGAGDDRKVTVKARRTGETNPRQITVRLGDVKTDNQWWTKQPDQQLVYSATRAWARRWAPAAILGVYSPEEMGKVIDVIPEPQIEGDAAAAHQQRAEAAVPAAAPAGERPAQEAQQPARKMTNAEWLDALQERLNDTLAAGDDVEAIITSGQVQTARQHMRNGAADRLEQMITNARERAQAHADDAAEAAIENEMALPE